MHAFVINVNFTTLSLRILQVLQVDLESIMTKRRLIAEAAWYPYVFQLSLSTFHVTMVSGCLCYHRELYPHTYDTGLTLIPISKYF